jgi:small GTP-binding protein
MPENSHGCTAAARRRAALLMISQRAAAVMLRPRLLPARLPTTRLLSRRRTAYSPEALLRHRRVGVCRCSSSSTAPASADGDGGAVSAAAPRDDGTAPAAAASADSPSGGPQVLLPSHISVRELARRLGRDHTAKRIASVVCLLHRRQKYWLHVEDDGAALDTPGEMYVFDRLSRVILPHRVAGRYAARHAGRTPVWQELEPLHVPRAPISGGAAGASGGAVQVVVILGHADHGKTTLLDQLRRDDLGGAIAPHEAGGITQRVGAWTASLGGEVRATFIDTPGQQLFGNMRRHGASAADVVLLVVAADEGILPQTAESAALAKQLELPLVVALNKVDVATPAEVNATRAALAELFIHTGQDGAGAAVVETSALTGMGMDTLRTALTEAVAAAAAARAADEAAEAALVDSTEGSGDGDGGAPTKAKKTKQRKKKKRRIRSGGSGSLRPGSNVLARGAAPATPTAVASVVEVLRSGTHQNKSLL